MNEAKESIRLQAFSFTGTDIVDALIKAHQRNVDVKVILDHSNFKANNPLLKQFIDEKIDVRIDKPHGIAHSNCNLSNTVTNFKPLYKQEKGKKDEPQEAQSDF
ncbi:phospholipase D-like domain-containing protein [Candidatus Paracaedibacter symbiosus]|uniref:phospholipase D-like domain-containing protein n=1 Tax=Candidatus Paracaedibacter symbiosus TaxID=244582 RepID=UPI0009FC9FDC